MHCARGVLVLAVVVLARDLVEPASAAPSTGDSLSIGDCMRIAHDAAPEVRVAAASAEAAKHESAAADRNGRPALDLVGNVHVAPSGSYDPALTNLGEYELQVGLTMPLFDGGARSRARERAAVDARSAARQLDAAARAAAARAGGLAVEILHLRERQEFESSALARLDDLVALLASRVQGGASGPSDLDRVRLERDALQSSLQSTRTAQDVAERELGQVLGMPPASLPSVRPPRPEEEREPAEADSSRLVGGASALPEVQLAADARARAGLDEADAEHRRSTRVDGTADAGLGGTDLTRAVPPDLLAENPDATLADRLRRDLGASASLTLTHPLLDAAAGPALDAKRAAARAADLEATAAAETQAREARDLVERWRDAVRRVHAEEDIVTRAERSLLRIRSLYVAGASGILDLLDAHRMLDDAKQAAADARAESRALAVEAETRS